MCELSLATSSSSISHDQGLEGAAQLTEFSVDLINAHSLETAEGISNNYGPVFA
jgi:hypothetical protein